MDPDVHEMLNIIAGGDESERRTLARRLVERPRPELLAALAATARSSEPLLLRSRCLEVLSLISRDGDEHVFRAVMAALGGENQGEEREVEE